MGFIEYNGRIQVHKSLLNVVLHDQPPSQNSVSASLLDTTHGKTKAAKRLTAAANKIEARVAETVSPL